MDPALERNNAQKRDGACLYIYTDSGANYESRVIAQEQQRQREGRGTSCRATLPQMRGIHMPDLGKVEITHLMQKKLRSRVEVVGV